MALPWKAIGALAAGAGLAVAGQHLVRHRDAVQVAARGPDGPAGGGEPVADQLQRCVVSVFRRHPEAGGDLQLVAAGCSIPHLDKAATGGEDAYFVSR
jgi:hypothetical protein